MILTPRERRFVGVVVCFAAAVVFIFLLGLVIWAFSQVFSFFSGVIWPLAVSGILTIMLLPVVSFLEKHLGLSRVSSVLVLYLLVISSAAIGIWMVAPKVVEQVEQLAESAPEWPRQIKETVDEWLPEKARGMFEALMLEFNESLGSVFNLDGEPPEIHEDAMSEEEKARAEEKQEAQNAEKKEDAEVLAKKASEALLKAKTFLISFFEKLTYLAIIPIYMFYFLGMRRNLFDQIEEEFGFLRPSLRADVMFLMREFVTIVVAFFRGQLIIAMVMGSLYGLGFYWAGLEFGLALGLLFGFLNIVPYLGSIVGLSVVVPLAYFQQDGGLDTLGFCLGAFAVVQLLEGYYLTPKIMGRQTGMHPVVVILSIFFWGTALNGLLGMIAAIPLTAFLIIAWRLLRHKYLVQGAQESEAALAET